jgi:uncharacterized protein (TIGR04255 family)
VISLTHGPQFLPAEDIPAHVRPGRHYDRAPIIEAVIDVQCELPPDVALDELARAADDAKFTLAGPAVQVSGRVDVSDVGITSDTSGIQVGHVFRRADGLRLIQSRLNGFSYSALAPYDRWESFSVEAWSGWLDYQRVARPARATRLAVRYVNRIDIPLSVVELKDYLRTAIDLSPYLPQTLAGYFWQAVVPLPRYSANATLISTAAQPPEPNYSSIVLDIDIWRTIDISMESSEANDDIQRQLEELRHAKNYVFEACITDATRGLIG